jgi:DNA-binding GntR family transcriptional regulator
MVAVPTPVNPDSATPPYMQVAEALIAQIAAGQLGPGARIPSITTLMGEFEVGKNTAIRAVGVLRDRGLVQTRQGWGTFVAEPG